MPRRFDNILGTIGHTPVVRINKLAPAGINLFVKVEAFNPMGSVKDRLALGVIEDAERAACSSRDRRWWRRPAATPASALPWCARRRAIRWWSTMAENFSVERRRLMRFLGAKVVLTPASEKGSGMLAKAVELAETHGWYLCRQFENEANPDCSFPDHRGRNPRRLQRRRARLLGERHGHRRHAQGRRAGAEEGAARTPGSSPASRTIRRSSAAACARRALPTARRARAIPISGRI